MLAEGEGCGPLPVRAPTMLNEPMDCGDAPGEVCLATAHSMSTVAAPCVTQRSRCSFTG